MEIKEASDNAKSETAIGDSKEEDRKDENSLKNPESCKRIKAYERRIEEKVEGEVYVIRVTEISFKDNFSDKILVVGKGEGKPEHLTKDSSSEASSGVRSKELESQSHRGKEEDALNAVDLGNLNNYDCSRDLVELNRHLGESEMRGTAAENVELSKQALSQEQDGTVNRRKIDEVELRLMEVDKWQYGESAQNTVDLNIFQETREPNHHQMGYHSELGMTYVTWLCPQIKFVGKTSHSEPKSKKSSWEQMVDDQNNVQYSKTKGKGNNSIVVVPL
ncbi:hypothetical protein V6N11_072773 [Hibiscus sabdariffa]|uniref:Uncharacterized protein n=1 Tax=Hibiscus sabdariffa TaxID=183260 RepID=A0ABR2NE38_9ROSI